MTKITFTDALLPKELALAVPVFEKDGRAALGAQGRKLDRKLGGALKKAMKTADFTGKPDETLTLIAPPRSKLSHLALIGAGKGADQTVDTSRRFGGKAIAALRATKAPAVAILADLADGAKLYTDAAAAAVADGARLRAWHFTDYFTKAKDKKAVGSVNVLTTDAAGARQSYAAMAAVTDGVLFARTQVAEPPNTLTPPEFAARCKALKIPGLKITVLDEKALATRKMGALLGVAQGSIHPPRLVVFEWQGGRKGEKPLAFIGKGVTFDSGGLSLKPPAGMMDMKWDMAGAGAVAGAMIALAGRKAEANIVGLIGLVENMPSATAQRPGDVVRSASGQTIEVLNTDAEGRLVLADVFHYAQETFAPRLLVDLATLTGAIIVTLGHEMAGLFSNDDALSAALTKAGQGADEPLWRLPLGDAYDQDLKSDIADMKNIGGGNAGSITAAQFLLRFVKNGTPWAHLDIAGMAWSKKDTALVPKGATAFGVRLLDRFVRDHHE